MYNKETTDEILVGLRNLLNEFRANKVEELRDYEESPTSETPLSYWVTIGLKIGYEVGAELVMSAIKNIQIKALVS